MRAHTHMQTCTPHVHTQSNKGRKKFIDWLYRLADTTGFHFLSRYTRAHACTHNQIYTPRTHTHVFAISTSMKPTIFFLEADRISESTTSSTFPILDCFAPCFYVSIPFFFKQQIRVTPIQFFFQRQFFFSKSAHFPPQKTAYNIMSGF